MSSTAKERNLGSHYLVQEKPKGIKGRLVDLRNLGDGSYRDCHYCYSVEECGEPLTTVMNVNPLLQRMRSSLGTGNHPFRGTSELGPTSCRIPQGKVDMSLVIYNRCSSFEKCQRQRDSSRREAHSPFRCLGGTGTGRPHNTFNRFALKVLAPIWIFTQHDPTRTLFFTGTATTFAGVNHVDAHFHDNLGLLSSRGGTAQISNMPLQSHISSFTKSMHALDTISFKCDPLLSPQRSLANSDTVTSSDSHTERLIRQTRLKFLFQSVFTHACRVKRVPSAKHLPFIKTTMSTAKGSSTGSPSIEITGNLPGFCPASQTSDTHWLEICVESQHILKSIQLSIGSFERESPCLLNATTHNFELSSPCQLSPSEPLYLQVRFRGLFRAASKSKIPLDELLKWSKSFDKFDVVLKFSRYAGVLSILECFNQGRTSDEGNLQPTTDELFKLVERFRVLVIGKVALLYLYSQVLAHSLFLQSGVGKSSLINECFGVKDAVRSLPRLLKIRC
ncbi:uncharacterized protein LACBIDRAFT_335301 [Laccaria bicolor S238N-H82]|uniref:Predicted protein n=1 Tax=Laccaria bicolor (strain S238N-H82 / ATCC MYA-4686) TaxID=486041 RepID=B0E1Y1_LACBS|nr:uncharacterized protein LACBIDRAFT_335301 [Laccaria bicolor S238N-H82]EDQ99145.1 predicted protein [Laccaria bicolor S238N-H82]|eukprot:XP_001890208.1 predicted protein [Laccaria bicolor S238N-H82]